MASSMTADALFRLKAHNDTNASFATAGKNLQRLEQSAQKVNRAFAGMDKMRKAEAMIGGLAGGVGVGMLFNMVKGVVSAGDEIGDMADATGFGVESIQSLMITARDAGVRLERLRGTLGDLRGKMDEARVEGGEKLAAAFAKLGVTADMLASGNVEAVFERIAGALKAGAGDATVTAAAHDVLGASVEKLGPVFAAAAEGLAKLNAEMRAGGEIMSKAEVKELSSADRELTRLWNMGKVGVGRAVSKIAATGVAVSTHISTGDIEQARQAGQRRLISGGAPESALRPRSFKEVSAEPSNYVSEASRNSLFPDFDPLVQLQGKTLSVLDKINAGIENLNRQSRNGKGPIGP